MVDKRTEIVLNNSCCGTAHSAVRYPFPRMRGDGPADGDGLFAPVETEPRRTLNRYDQV